MKAVALILWVSVLSPAALYGSGVDLVVPNDAENQEGNDASVVPFVIAVGGTERYQQVYEASQFSAVKAGGSFVTEIYFRPDCYYGTGGSLTTNLLVNFSTTSKMPDQLSSVFAENVGQDDTRVFGPGKLIAGGEGGPTNNCPRGLFTGDSLNRILLDTPFFYNPARGNLLLDARVSGVNQNFPGGGQLDAVNVPSDSVSRVYAYPVESTVANQMDTIGLVTGFGFHDLPSLAISLTTNTVVIAWPVQPKNFLLYWADKLGTNDNFQLFGGQIGGDALYHAVSLPLDTFGQSRFFRLICSTCPPVSSPAPPPAARAGREILGVHH